MTRKMNITLMHAPGAESIGPGFRGAQQLTFSYILGFDQHCDCCKGMAEVCELVDDWLITGRFLMGMSGL